jgi:hypothetical protein
MVLKEIIYMFLQGYNSHHGILVVFCETSVEDLIL